MFTFLRREKYDVNYAVPITTASSKNVSYVALTLTINNVKYARVIMFSHACGKQLQLDDKLVAFL